MILSNEDKKYIVERLPDIELSYDRIIHKKVYADIYLVIPKGNKALVWFTYFNDKNVCIVLELDKNNNINNMYITPYCFDNELSYNTLLYGTLKIVNNAKFFVCEDILYYKNNNLTFTNYNQKLLTMNDLFKNIKNTIYFNSNFIITTPIIKNNYLHAINEINLLNYEAYGLKSINLNSNEPLGIIKIDKHSEEAIFKVMADIKQDIYKLYCLDKQNKFVYFGIAMIPDYKTSVFMNNLFRTIKENKNLDFLEESDDEEEFENTQEDKYVNLTKSIIMNCVYNDKFRKWKPVSIANKHSKVINKNDLYKFQNRYK